MSSTATRERRATRSLRTERGVVPSFERTLNDNMRALKADITELGDRAKAQGNPKLAGALYALARATDDEGTLNRVASALLGAVEPSAGRDEASKLHPRPEDV